MNQPDRLSLLPTPALADLARRAAEELRSRTAVPAVGLDVAVGVHRWPIVAVSPAWVNVHVPVQDDGPPRPLTVVLPRPLLEAALANRPVRLVPSTPAEA